MGLVVAATGALTGCDFPDPGTAVLLDVPADNSAPALQDAPYPSDAHLTADRHLEPPPGLDRLFWRNADLVAAHLAELDGFGVRPLVEFPVDGPIDPDTLPGHAYVLDAAGDPIAYDWRFDPDRLVIQGAPSPGVVLPPAQTFTAVVETEILDLDGNPLRSSPGLDRLRRGDPPERWRTTADALSQPDSDRWAGVAVFTTQRAQRTMRAARATLGVDTAAPTLTFDDPALVFAGPERLEQLLGVASRFDDGPRTGQEHWGMSNPTGIAHDHVGAIATGNMTTTRFRRPDTETDGPEDETFDIDPITGAPVPISADEIAVTLIVPTTPPPPSGYPVAIFGHGLGSSRHAALAFAEPLTAAGYVVAAIDADGHGSRYRDIDLRNNLSAMLREFSGDPDIADGFGDDDGLLSTFAFLENLRNFSATRDGVCQSVLDLSQLVAALRSPDLDLSALGVVPLDPSRISYLGESFGTLLGGVLAAVEPDVDLYVLDVPAAGVIDLSIVNSPAMASLLEPIARVTYDLDGTIDRFHPAVAMLQSLVDAADPITYAPNVLRDRLPVGDVTPGPRHVIAIEVVGDEVLPNVASDALAIAFGLDVLAPHAQLPPGVSEIASPASANRDGQTGVLVQYAPATHGANWTSETGTIHFVPGFPHAGDERFPRLDQPIEIENPIYPTLEQVVEILTTHDAGGPPIVRSTLPPSP